MTVVIGPVLCECGSVCVEKWVPTQLDWAVTLGCLNCDRGHLAFGKTLRDARLEARRVKRQADDTKRVEITE
jgi:hypothetical protein